MDGLVILEALFYQVDAFCISFMHQWKKTLIEAGVCRKIWQCILSLRKNCALRTVYRNKKRVFITSIQRL